MTIPHYQLRRDIEIIAAEADFDGRLAVIAADPLCQTFLRLPWPESEMLRALRAEPGDFAGAAATRLGYAPEKDELDAFLTLLSEHHLVVAREPRQWRGFARANASRTTGLGSRLLSQYLFFRVPLLRPDRMLMRIAAATAHWPMRGLFVCHLLAALAGGYLISHQWDAFVETLQRATEIEQLALFGVAIILLKAVHEFGHAIVASRLGCHVPTIGVAFMMGAPVLYTDTTDTWRLPERRKRLAVVFAGVGAEMAVAAWMAALWPFLPPGTARDLAFSLMTVSVATSLAVNLNPLMRFDGYFALSDWLRMPNLQSRAFAIGRWRMREALFGLQAPPPEDVTPARAWFLALYAWAMWLYRLVIAAAIAWAVYAFAVKLVGIALFIVELVVLVAAPVFKEVRMWWVLRRSIVARSRAWLSAAAAVAALALAVYPWWSRVEIPAIMAAAVDVPVHPPSSARIVSVAVANGQMIQKGDILAELEAPQLNLQIAQIGHLAEALRQRRGRAAGIDQDRDQLAVIDAELDRLAARQAAFERQAAELTLRARDSGIVVDVDHLLRAGVWVRTDNAIARIVRGDHGRARGLVHAVDLPRIAIGARGWFIPDDPSLPRITVILKDVSPTVERPIHEPALADVHGGPVPSGSERNELVPTVAVYSVVLETDHGIELRGGWKATPTVRGIVQLEGQAESFAFRALRRIAQVLAREQSF